eukprot:3095388-Pyramimonas_sp.AAC.1
MAQDAPCVSGSQVTDRPENASDRQLARARSGVSVHTLLDSLSDCRYMQAPSCPVCCNLPPLRHS